MVYPAVMLLALVSAIVIIAVGGWIAGRPKLAKPATYFILSSMLALLAFFLSFGGPASKAIAAGALFAAICFLVGFIGMLAKQHVASLKKRRRCPSCGDQLPLDAPHGVCPRCLLKQGFKSPVEALGAAHDPAASAYQGPFAVPSVAEMEKYFPQLEILELLGQGGMGAVYKARQTKLDRLVALKILPPGAGRDPAFAERFTREARALARLNHPSIVSVHDFGDAGGLFYVIMEYVDGVNLRQVLRGDPVPAQDALRIIPQICDALQYAHDQGIVHRDIKPENILLDKQGRVKIADFGLAKLLGPTAGSFALTGSQQIMGTPHYMAPEQMERPSTVDHRADIYSLGVVFYEMLTGELPLGRFALPSEKVAVDGRLDEIVLRALDKAPERRFQKVSEVKLAMESLTGAEPLLVQPVQPVFSFQDEVDQELRRLQVSGPGLGLMAAGVLSFLSWAIPFFVSFLDPLAKYHYGWDLTPDDMNKVFFVAPAVVLASSLIFAGGYWMRRFEKYELVVLAGILAIVPWSLVAAVATDAFHSFLFSVLAGVAMPVSLGMGVWALCALRRPEVKLAFVRKVIQGRRNLTPRPMPAKPHGGKLRSVVGSVYSLFLGSRIGNVTSSSPRLSAAAGGSAISEPSAEQVRVASSAPSNVSHSRFTLLPLAIPFIFLLLVFLAYFVTVTGTHEAQPATEYAKPLPALDGEP